MLRIIAGNKSIINTLAVLPDRRLASGSDDRTIKRWDPATGDSGSGQLLFMAGAAISAMMFFHCASLLVGGGFQWEAAMAAICEALIPATPQAVTQKAAERLPLRQQSCPLGLTSPPGGPTDDHETDLDTTVRDEIRKRMSPPNQESVAHCSGRMEGRFLRTMVATDIANCRSPCGASMRTTTRCS